MESKSEYANRMLMMEEMAMIRKLLFACLFSCLLFSLPVFAENGKPQSGVDYLELSGYWRFSPDPDDVGIQQGWFRPEFSEEMWPEIKVPGYWEDQDFLDENLNYPDSAEPYNGFAWYRFKFFIPHEWQGEEDYFLVIGAISGYDWTYINGRLVGLTGSETSEFNTLTREYRLTPDKIFFNKVNSIAIRVYNAEGKGGISRGPVILVKGSTYRRNRWWAENKELQEKENKNYNVKLKVAFNRRSEPLIFDFYHHTGMGAFEHGWSLKFKVWDKSMQTPLAMYFDTHFDRLPPDLRIYSYGIMAVLGEPVFGIAQPYIGGGFTHTFSGTPIFNRGFYSLIGGEFCEIYFIERQYIGNPEGTFIHRFGWRVKF